MTIFNIVTEENLNRKKIEKIKEDRDIQITMIEEKFKIVEEKFLEIFNKSILEIINMPNIDKYKEAKKKAEEIQQKIENKKSMIRSNAQEKIDQIKAEEKQAKINELDNLVNEICA